MSTQTKKEVSQRLKKPNNYAVVLFNDDKTLFDFVVELLIKLFNKSKNEALILTDQINTKGEAQISVYPKNIAQMKLMQSMTIARTYSFPLTGEIREVTND